MDRRRRIVLLGVGHTNADVVRRWAETPIPDTELVCVSRFPFATYSGMLPGTLAGQFTPEEMQIDLRRLARRANANLLLANVTGMDPDRRLLRFSDAEPLRFDALSVGVGSMPSGLAASTSAVVPIKPMQTFLERLDGRLASACQRGPSPRRIAVVGGGTAGVEIALCLQARLDGGDSSDPVSIQIFTSGADIAPDLRPRSVHLLKRVLSRRGIQVHTRTRVVATAGNFLTTSAGASHPADAVVWATGAVGPPVLAALGLPTDERGFLQTHPTLQTTAELPVFAVGDSGTVVESPYPKAGVFAVRQAPILWHNLKASLMGMPLEAFRPQGDFLKLLNTGEGKALLEWKGLSIHSRWCLRLKTWIDKRFIGHYQFAGKAATCSAASLGEAA